MSENVTKAYIPIEEEKEYFGHKCLTEEEVRRIAAEVFIEILERMAKKYKFKKRDNHE